MQKIIEKFIPQGGKHCITNSLKQIFDFYGCPLSEDMLFGIGDGLDFTYINLASAPMVSGRVKIMEFEETLSKRLGISIRVKQSKDYNAAFDRARQMIDSDNPVLVYVDMPHMDYLGMDENSHFGGHSVVLFGYDDEKACFYVSERDNAEYPIRTPNGSISDDYHLVSYGQMKKAHSSNHRPFPANNKYLEFDLSGFQGVSKDNLIATVRATCDRMLNPPANLKGVNGIAKFSKEISKWGKFDTGKLKQAGVTNYFQINADGGTGGGIFRKMFGGFLLEAAPVIQNAAIEEIGNGFIGLSVKWDTIAQEMWQLHETGNAALLEDMSCGIAENHHIEVELHTKLRELVLLAQ
jgi:hypothetical protein